MGIQFWLQSAAKSMQIKMQQLSNEKYFVFQ